ncbi:MAG: hypothetical protein DA330_04880 [Nitrososphaera sp.]|nr:hypothetical protein [Nitrososphaera sp.]
MFKRKEELIENEQHFLLCELQSLGLNTIRLNEFNDNTELSNLITSIKNFFLKCYHNKELSFCHL